MPRQILMLIAVLILSGCAGNMQSLEQANRPVVASDKDKTSVVKERLMAQYYSWKGAPYKLGGQSRKGIDCSAFVMLTFREQMGKKLPRTTLDQVQKGHAVARSKLAVGDLVFFKTSYNVRHVGIYMGNDEFLHASTSVGVTISKLNNPYWKRRYWTARRV